MGFDWISWHRPGSWHWFTCCLVWKCIKFVSFCVRFLSILDFRVQSNFSWKLEYFRTAQPSWLLWAMHTSFFLVQSRMCSNGLLIALECSPQNLPSPPLNCLDWYTMLCTARSMVSVFCKSISSWFQGHTTFAKCRAFDWKTLVCDRGSQDQTHLNPWSGSKPCITCTLKKMNVMKWMKLLKRMDVMNVIVRNRWCKALDSFFVAAYTLDLLREDKSSRAHRNSGAFFAIQRHQLPRHNVQTMAKAKALTPFFSELFVLPHFCSALSCQVAGACASALASYIAHHKVSRSEKDKFFGISTASKLQASGIRYSLRKRGC